MNTWDKCKNCGGDYGIHHYQTNQCPVGGREAPIGRRQEWKTTTFELEYTPPTDEQIKAELKEWFIAFDGNGIIVTDENLLDEGLNICNFVSLRKLFEKGA